MDSLPFSLNDSARVFSSSDVAIKMLQRLERDLADSAARAGTVLILLRCLFSVISAICAVHCDI